MGAVVLVGESSSLASRLLGSVGWALPQINFPIRMMNLSRGNAHPTEDRAIPTIYLATDML